jgi:hypothetical protein
MRIPVGSSVWVGGSGDVNFCGDAKISRWQQVRICDWRRPFLNSLNIIEEIDGRSHGVPIAP